MTCFALPKVVVFESGGVKAPEKRSLLYSIKCPEDKKGYKLHQRKQRHYTEEGRIPFDVSLVDG